MIGKRARTFVIVGNGIAGVTAAEILRAEDAAAQIFIIADDLYPVYYRPALKDFLAGRVREDVLRARPGDFYAEQRIACVPDHVTGIAVEQQYIQLQSGRQLAYDRLLLANGARPNTLTCPGSNLAGVTTLRSVADYQHVLKRLDTAQHIVVVGSGTLALESVESLRQRGYAVSHLLRRNILWSEVLDATASDLVLQQEMRDGADVYLEEEVVEILPVPQTGCGEQGRVSGVVTTKGKRIACDMVIIAIGITPNIDFIQRSGIACGRGVQVDARMRTNAPHIYAAGDVVETSNSMTGRTRVIGQWYPAIQQARAAAYSMLEVLDTSYYLSPGEGAFQTTTFYNATFLYGLDFASVGITNLVDSRVQTVVANPQPRTYRKATLANGVPIGMLSLGDRAGTLAFKRAIDYRVNLSSVASVLFADHFKLDDWLNNQGVPPPILGVKRIGEYAETDHR